MSPKAMNALSEAAQDALNEALKRVEELKAENEAAEAENLRLHDALARMEETHAEAVRSVRLRAEVAEARLAEAEKALVSLTPDGSEFYRRDGDGYRVDVAACLTHLRDRREREHNRTVEIMKRLKAAEAENNRLAELHNMELARNCAADAPADEPELPLRGEGGAK